MGVDQNIALVRRAVEEVWNRGDLNVADDLFDAAYINHAGLITDIIRGPEAIKSSVALYRAAFPGFQINVDELTAKRDTVLLRWTARRMPQPGRAASVPPGKLSGLFVSRCAAGKIAESWMSWDQAGVLAGLGLTPPPRRKPASATV